MITNVSLVTVYCLDGVEAVIRDVSGCWLVLVEPREYAGGAIDPAATA